MLSHDVGQLVLVLPPKIFASCDCRRVEAHTAGLGEGPFVVVADEGCRCLEAVGAAVGVEDVSFEGGPLQLLGEQGSQRQQLRNTRGESKKKSGSDAKDKKRLLTPGVLFSCVLAVVSGTGAAAEAAAAAAAAATIALVALAFVTSRRLEPALLATRRILVLAWVPAPPPFFSFKIGASPLESSWPLRAALEGAMRTRQVKGSRGFVVSVEERKREGAGVCRSRFDWSHPTEQDSEVGGGSVLCWEEWALRKRGFDNDGKRLQPCVARHNRRGTPSSDDTGDFCALVGGLCGWGVRLSVPHEPPGWVPARHCLPDANTVLSWVGRWVIILPNIIMPSLVEGFGCRSCMGAHG